MADTRAAEVLLAEGAWLRRLAGSLVANDVDDAVQDTYVAALVARPDTGRPVRPWLAQVLRNFLRMRHRARGRAQRAVELLAAEDSSLPSAADLMEHHEAQRLVAEAVSGLEEPFRSTILLRYSEGLAPAEIATRLQIPAATVRSRLKRGLDELRARLDRRCGDRRAWRALLLPLAPRRPRTLPAALAVGAVAALTIASLALLPARPRVVSSPAPAPLAPPVAQTNKKGPSTMTQPSLPKKNIAVAIAVLAAASAAVGAETELPRAQAISECVTINEKRQACVEEYAAQAVAEHLAQRKKTVTAAERKAMEVKVVEAATQEGAGPLAPRQQKCERMLDHIQKSGGRATRAAADALHACFEKPDCPARITCYLAESARLIPAK